MKLSLFNATLLLSHCASAVLSNQQPISSSSTTTSSSKLLSLHKSLIEHSSISGNEHAVGTYLIAYLESLNLTVETQAVAPKTSSSSPSSSKQRFNILAYPGTTRKTRTLVSSHIDVVPPYWPYERRGDEIWGRGSVDAKGCVAAQTIAFAELFEARAITEGDVGLLFVVGEEEGGDGMRRANDLDLTWETVIFGEPTELKLASGHKGMLSFTIHATGKAGHSGYPELGKSANAMLISALYALQTMDLPWSEHYGNTTLNIGQIEGGVAGNVIAEKAMAKLSVRIAAGTPNILKELVMNAVRAADPELEVVWASEGYAPVFIDSDVKGFETIVVNYGTDIPNLKGDHKRYLYGAGSILVAHSDHEHLKIEDLEEAVVGYKRLIEHSLK